MRVWDRMGGNRILRELRGWAPPGPRRAAGVGVGSTWWPLPAALPGQASHLLLPGRLPARCWDLTRNSPSSRVLLL